MSLTGKIISSAFFLITEDKEKFKCARFMFTLHSRLIWIKIHLQRTLQQTNEEELSSVFYFTTQNLLRMVDDEMKFWHCTSSTKKFSLCFFCYNSLHILGIYFTWDLSWHYLSHCQHTHIFFRKSAKRLTHLKLIRCYLNVCAWKLFEWKKKKSVIHQKSVKSMSVKLFATNL